MDEIDKLIIVLPNWMEHNDEHAKIYKNWAEKMPSLGKKELSVLEIICQESQILRGLFQEPLRVVDI